MSRPLPLPAEEWTIEGFLHHFMDVHATMDDRSFMFVLGSGASRPSGIHTGGELVQRWLVELQHRFSAAPLRPLAEWATDETLAIPGFEITRAAEFYPQVYSRRFRGDPDEGFAQLESMMEGKDPSFGYSVLAQVLAATRHRVVITTNFDHLVADALAIYTRTHPLVCGHESLTSFVRARMRRPLIAKIHRDLLLAPFSSPEETASLAAEWKQALRTLFQHFVPIVIGYGGNDGSFMGFLEALQPGDIAGRLFWCYRQQDGLPAERIRTIVSRHSGVFVPILGFDELMLLLGERLGFGLLNDAIDRSAQERKERYQAQVDEIMSRLGRLGRSEQTKEAAEKVGDALAVTLRDSGATAALFTAQRTEDTHEKTKRYREALERYPNDRATWRGYARAAASEIGDRKLAARLYRDAIRKFPSDVGILLDAAHFFGESHNYKRSRELYERVLKVAPNNAVALNELGLIAIDERNPAEAESFYRRALTIMPSDPVLLTNLAIVLSHDRGRYEEAERHFRNALEIRPGAAPIQINFVMLLFERERFEEAEMLAAEIDHSAPDRLAARLHYVQAAIAAIRDKDEMPHLRQLRAVLEAGFERGPYWSFDPAMRVISEHLPAKRASFYERMANAISTGRVSTRLATDPQWKAIEPLAE